MQRELPIPTTSVRNKESSSSNNLEIKQVLVNEVWKKKGEEERLSSWLCIV
jgi:hypothetical protein